MAPDYVDMEYHQSAPGYVDMGYDRCARIWRRATWTLCATSLLGNGRRTTRTWSTTNPHGVCPVYVDMAPDYVDMEYHPPAFIYDQCTCECLFGRTPSVFGWSFGNTL